MDDQYLISLNLQYHALERCVREMILEHVKMEFGLGAVYRLTDIHMSFYVPFVLQNCGITGEKFMCLCDMIFPALCQIRDLRNNARLYISERYPWISCMTHDNIIMDYCNVIRAITRQIKKPKNLRLRYYYAGPY